jgi:hypothetical protein
MNTNTAHRLHHTYVERSRRTVLLLGALLCVVLPGCSTTGDQQVPQSRQFTQLADLAPTGEVVCDALIPPGRDAAAFIDLEADGQPVPFFAQDTTMHDASIEVHFGDEETGRTEYWSNTNDGALHMTASLDHRENALSLFRTPLLLLDAKLAAGASAESTGPMRVVSASNPKNQKASGDAKRTITYAGDTRLALGKQRLRCKRLEATFTANLSLAATETTTTYWIAPEHGLVAFREHTVIKVLGVVSDERTRHYVRILD